MCERGRVRIQRLNNWSGLTLQRSFARLFLVSRSCIFFFYYFFYHACENSLTCPPQIIIRDPNQGGKDITEEIMSGGRSASTPTPPQVTHLHFSTSVLKCNKFLSRVNEMFYGTNVSLNIICSMDTCITCTCMTFLLNHVPLFQSVLSTSEGGAITQSNGEKATPPVAAARTGKECINK